MECSKKDWIIFKNKIGDWQEVYMDKLTKEYCAILKGKQKASEKFWELEAKIKKDRKHPGVLLEMKKKNVISTIVILLQSGAITFDDLEEFTDELKQAVLYAWESIKPENDSENDDVIVAINNTDLFNKLDRISSFHERDDFIYAFVEGANTEYLKTFLTNIFLKDQQTLKLFYEGIPEASKEERIKKSFWRVDMITAYYLKDDGCVSYFELSGYLVELNASINYDVRGLMDEKDYLNAFLLLNYIFMVLGNVKMQDYGGGTEMLSGVIYEYWLEILSCATLKEKQKMFEWFTTHVEGSVIYCMKEYLERIIREEFWENEYLVPKLVFYKDMILKAEAGELFGDITSNVGKWVLDLLFVLRYINASESDIEEICHAYFYAPIVRLFYADFCIEKQEYARAKEVLDECRKVEEDFDEFEEYYNKKKKEISHLLGDKKSK